jgi:hypothetical protein
MKNTIIKLASKYLLKKSAGWTSSNPSIDWNYYQEKARDMTDAELHGALLDISKTKPHSRELDKQDNGDREGWYSDEASIYHKEIENRKNPKYKRTERSFGPKRPMSMTHGEMPPKEQFEAAFREHVHGSRYTITSGASGSLDEYAGSYTADELYDLVESIRYNWAETEDSRDIDNCGASVASSIMQTLGFEWI